MTSLVLFWYQIEPKIENRFIKVIILSLSTHKWSQDRVFTAGGDALIILLFSCSHPLVSPGGCSKFSNSNIYLTNPFSYKYDSSCRSCPKLGQVLTTTVSKVPGRNLGLFHPFLLAGIMKLGTQTLSDDVTVSICQIRFDDVN